MAFPTFDRNADAVVPNGGVVTKDDHTILVEGNYLLLNVVPWSALSVEWDLSVMLEVPLAELERRLVARWCTHGYDAAGALARAQSNDLPNATFVQQHSVAPDLTVAL